MKKITKAVLVASLTLAAAAGSVGTALAATTFAIVDNGGVLVTRFVTLDVGDVFTVGGVPHTVTGVSGLPGSEIIQVQPGFPASDDGKVLSASLISG